MDQGLGSVTFTLHQIIIIRANEPTREVGSKSKSVLNGNKKDLQQTDHQGAIRRKHPRCEHTAWEKLPGTRDVMLNYGS